MIYRGSPWETGSSPRMWGTPSPSFTLLPRGRFIPTHVGNTSLQTDSHCYPAVHPHACGEHRTEEITQRVEDGSSPRMWGTLRIDLLRIELRRFIPTHVGNTSVGIEHCDIWAVHPHACGEHLKAVAWVDKVDGSSPRMWGTLEGVGSENEAIRFIPTHVGNTVVADMQGFAGSVHPHACGEHTYRTELFLKKKKHLEKSTASSSIPWSDPEAGMPPIAARRTTLDVDG